MKKFKISDMIIVFLLVIALAYTYFNRKELSNYLYKIYIVNSESISYTANNYAKKANYNYVQNTNNYVPNNKQDLYNLIYTIVNNGWDEFEFYCGKDYDACDNDIKTMSTDGTLNTFNNFVNPYNSYKTMHISISNFGIIKVNVLKNYSEWEINDIEDKLNSVIKQIITPSMTDEEKIHTFHDYIVNNTTYDSAEAELVGRNISLDLESYKAYNVLINHLGLCGGYADTLSLFLDKMNIPNYKISTSDHVWNVVKLNNKWIHIDMTWDDPVASNNMPSLIHDYYLIDTKTLLNLNDGKHVFNQDIYSELKQTN